MPDVVGNALQYAPRVRVGSFDQQGDRSAAGHDVKNFLTYSAARDGRGKKIREAAGFAPTFPHRQPGGRR